VSSQDFIVSCRAGLNKDLGFGLKPRPSLAMWQCVLMEIVQLDVYFVAKFIGVVHRKIAALRFTFSEQTPKRQI